MAELKVTTTGFELKSTWTCSVTYEYTNSGSLVTVYQATQETPSTATKTVAFVTDLPYGAKIISAKVHATHTLGDWNGGTFTINDIAPDSNGFVTLNNSVISDGTTNITFKWKSTKHSDPATRHKDDYPPYTGGGAIRQSKTFDHSSTSKISDVYLLIEYEGGSIIYHGESGKLVGYKLFHAENGVLVPYQIKLAENGNLITYG